MAHSDAKTVSQYLSSLPVDRREAVSIVRQVVLDNLPSGFEEAMQYGMIGYVVPLATYPKTYNKQPLTYAALASQKNYISLYLMCVYSDQATEARFTELYRASGKRLNMGKSCVRFKRLEDLPLDVIGETIGGTSMEEYIRRYEESRSRPNRSQGDDTT